MTVDELIERLQDIKETHIMAGRLIVRSSYDEIDLTDVKDEVKYNQLLLIFKK